MKRHLLLSTTAVAALCGGPVAAADLPRAAPAPAYKAPVALSPAFSWTGFYIGGNVGAAYRRSSETETDIGNGFFTPQPFNVERTSFIGGVQAGFNWQVGSFVVGFEGDYNWVTSSNDTTFFLNGTAAYNSSMKSFATARGRLGVVATPNLLIYATGGAAFANITNQIVDTNFPFTAGRSGWSTGWTAGGGIEYALTNNWTVKAEAIYAQFSDLTVIASPVPYSFTFKDSVTVARGGINYKF